MELNPLIKIKHPMADEISIQDSQYHHCTVGESSEIAFFKNGDFVLTPIEPFADYHDGADKYGMTTSVYDYVPNSLIEAFLEENMF